MAELSRMTGVSKTTINAMYHDRVREIDYDVLECICEALDGGLSDILEYAKEGYPRTISNQKHSPS